MSNGFPYSSCTCFDDSLLLRPVPFTSFPIHHHIRHHIIIAFQKSWCNVLLLQGMPDLPWGGRCWGKSRGCNGLGIPLESPRIPAAAPSAAVPHTSHGRYVVLVICAVACDGTVSNTALKILRSRSQKHRTATVCNFFLIILCCEYGNGSLGFLKSGVPDGVRWDDVTCSQPLHANP